MSVTGYNLSFNTLLLLVRVLVISRGLHRLRIGRLRRLRVLVHHLQRPLLQFAISNIKKEETTYVVWLFATIRFTLNTAWW